MRKNMFSITLYLLSALSAAVTVFVLSSVTLYIMTKGLPHIKFSLFHPDYTSENLSLMPAAINTVLMIFFVVLLAVPISILSAVYLSEYSNNSAITSVIESAVKTLASIPSIIYGVFGYLCFTVKMKLGFSFLSGSITMALMVLPLIISSTQAALEEIPKATREGGAALGAGKGRVAVRLLVPAARRGITAGIVLSVGKVIGETAALIYTLGTNAETVSGLFSSGRTLAVHIYALCCEGIYIDQAYATSAVLIMLVAIINIAAELIYFPTIRGKKNEG